MNIQSSPVMKRLIKLIPILIGALAAFVTISSTNKHLKETGAYLEQYRSSFATLTSYVNDVNSSGFNKTARLKSVKDDAAKEIQKLREVVDYFERIKPPKSIRSEHEAILAAIPAEREFLNAVEAFFNSSTEQQMRKNADKVVSFYDDQNSESGFPHAVVRFAERINYKRSHGTKYNRFIWI